MPSTTLIKIGGALLESPALLSPLWTAVERMRGTQRVILVHGGGPQATRVARSLGHEPRVVQGRRVTTELDLQILLWTTRGELNSRLVAQAIANGMPGVGLSGADAGMIRAARRPPREVDGETVDFGLVGDVLQTDTSLLHTLLAAELLPIVAPLGVGNDGALYNINADTVACVLAESVGAQQFLLVTEMGGIRLDPGDAETVLSDCTESQFKQGVDEGWISGGMRVKMEVGLNACRAGIPHVRIVSPGDLGRTDGGTRILLGT